MTLIMSAPQGSSWQPVRSAKLCMCYASLENWTFEMRFNSSDVSILISLLILMNVNLICLCLFIFPSYDLHMLQSSS